MPARPRNVSRHRAAELAERACTMNVALTPSEARLREELRASRLGVAFLRQAVVGHYVVDFLAPPVRLVVVVDGGYRAERARADARPDERLRGMGYRVVRVTAEEGVRRTEGAVQAIRAAIAQR